MGIFHEFTNFFNFSSSDKKFSARKDMFLPTVIQRDKKLDVNVRLGNYSNISVNMYNNEGVKTFEDKQYVVLTLNKR
jgi:hypothetical protein